MKKYIFLALFVASSFQLCAQRKINSVPVSVAYWGHIAFHPGIKAGTQFDLKSWNKTKIRRGNEIIKHRHLFIRPEIGYYYHQKNHSGVLLNGDLGIEFSKGDKRFYKAFSLGWGHFNHINAGTTYIQKDDGTITTKKAKVSTYNMPSFNVEYGQHLSTITWYNKITLASKLQYNTSVSVEAFFEVGIRFYPF